MRVGDLVRHTGSLGMGIVVGPEEHPYEEEGSYVPRTQRTSGGSK